MMCDLWDDLGGLFLTACIAEDDSRVDVFISRITLRGSNKRWHINVAGRVWLTASALWLDAQFGRRARHN